MSALLQAAGRAGKPIIATGYGADTIVGLHDVAPTLWAEEYEVAYLEM